MQSKIIVLGGAAMDIKYHCYENPQLGTSNPVRSKFTEGGVARNIAHNLSLLELPVELMSIVGKDLFGDRLVQSSQSLGISPDGLSRSLSNPTATYSAIIRPNGEMWTAIADMSILDELHSGLIQNYTSAIIQSELTIVDTNLSAESLIKVAEIVRTQSQANFWAVAVSVPKTPRLHLILPYLNGLILNEDELASLYGKPILSFSDLHRICSEIVRSSIVPGGLKLIVTRGKKGAAIVTPKQSYNFEIDPSSSLLQDVTGAGDAFAAGVFSSLYRKESLVDAVKFGMAAAQMTLESTETVHPELSLKRVRDRMKTLKHQIREVL